MKYLIILILILSNINSKEIDVDIKADSFSANQKNNLITFTGNVSMIKGADTLKCQRLEVHTKIDKKTNQTIAKQYIASGKVYFTIKQPDTILIGKGNIVNYNIDKLLYTITGNAYLEDQAESKILTGEKIYINEKTGNTKIVGKKNKPVRFKFKMQSKEN
jgi:lipopolysaccharide export system protein LptA